MPGFRDEALGLSPTRGRLPVDCSTTACAGVDQVRGDLPHCRLSARRMIEPIEDRKQQLQSIGLVNGRLQCGAR